MYNLLAVFIGGGMGSLLRYGIGKLVVVMLYKTSFPLATLVANFLSVIIFTCFIKLSQQQHYTLSLLVITGFCGGLSTFSTFSYESFLLIQQEKWLWLTFSITLNIMTCLGIFLIFVKNKI